MKKELKIKIIKTAILLLVAAICFFGLRKPMTSVEFHKSNIESLEEKKSTVMELAASATAASVAVSMLPGDTATPIADKLADLSFYFVIILSAIFLEKYLLTITGYATFMILLPLACVLGIAYVWIGNETFKYVAKKMVVFGIMLFLIIPISVKVSDMIETTYESSIQNTIESTKENAEELSKETEGKDESYLEQLWSKVEGGVTSTADKFEKTFNNLVESIAIMLVTSCLIPILILLFFVWLIKMYFNVPISIDKIYMMKNGWKVK